MGVYHNPEDYDFVDDAPEPKGDPFHPAQEERPLHPQQFGQHQQHVFTAKKPQAAIGQMVAQGYQAALKPLGGGGVIRPAPTAQSPKVGLPRRDGQMVRNEAAGHFRPRFAVSTNLHHQQFGQVLIRDPQKVTIHHGQFTGTPGSIYSGDI